MKRFSLTLMLSVILAVGYAQTYSFSEVCETGQALYYQILDNTVDYTVKLVAPNPYLPYWDEGTEPTGDMRIPDVVSHEGKTSSCSSLCYNPFLLYRKVSFCPASLLLFQ